MYKYLILLIFIVTVIISFYIFQNVINEIIDKHQLWISLLGDFNDLQIRFSLPIKI